MNTSDLNTLIQQFSYYRMLGEKAISQLSDDALHYCYNEESNSVATIVQHLAGNMKSRWTDFLTTDGEKPWRDREAEFASRHWSRIALMEEWDSGWRVLLETLQALREEDLGQIVYIRNQGHTVAAAIYRQLAHYSYHVGQIVFLAKMYAPQWASLSIPRGGSEAYSADKFSEPKHVAHFTDEYLQPKS